MKFKCFGCANTCKPVRKTRRPKSLTIECKYETKKYKVHRFGRPLRRCEGHRPGRPSQCNA